MGVSVTQRINKVKQPRGGYLNPKQMEIIHIDTKNELINDGKGSPILIGLTVDYLTRYMSGAPKEESFKISLMGATLGGFLQNANKLLNSINGLDDESIQNAFKLTGYDVIYRAGIDGYYPIEFIEIDQNTILDIRELVNRSLYFFKNYGPVVVDGFTFKGGYTETVSAGDGDFLTKDTLWDFKVSKNPPTNKHTLQLLMYYIMGIHSIHKEFKSIEYLAIYNPKLNNIYRYKISNIKDETIKEIEQEVICY